MQRASLLLVDDDRFLLESMTDWLRSQNYAVEAASSVRAAQTTLAERKFDIVLSDIRLGDGDGFDLLHWCNENQPESTVILMTGYGSVEIGVEAVRAGAFDLLTKPLIDEELEIAIDRALSQRLVLHENQQLKKQLEHQYGLDNVIGSDHRMVKIYDMIASVADTRATILITGESGTGKSMIARAIHRQSSRKSNPFVEVACGALPENLLESELFGHVQGAFTGATANKQGKFLQADQGTIFLDEIGTATQGMQVKLLRVLQELQFEPVGGSQTLSVDVRAILATNDDLQKAVAEGTFRQDLYYRVNVINIELPPLRERITDVPMLAEHFLREVASDAGRQTEGFSQAAMTALQRYGWPGNVRELQNVIERAVLLGKGRSVESDDLPMHIQQGMGASSWTSPTGRTLKEALEEPERQIILDSLREHDWNRNETADSLGINRTTLYKKMKRLGLDDVSPVSMH
ncbi:MAG: sigma-54 dependent transcriptional regulator [bacterium]|nr:sigma-54 dependent transcriptional regulator [bacterium]